MRMMRTRIHVLGYIWGPMHVKKRSIGVSHFLERLRGDTVVLSPSPTMTTDGSGAVAGVSLCLPSLCAFRTDDGRLGNWYAVWAVNGDNFEHNNAVFSRPKRWTKALTKNLISGGVTAMRGKTKTTPKGPKRFQFEINRELWTELEQIQEMGGMSTMKELLNNALTILRWSARHKQMGHAIAAVGEDGRIHELAIPCLETLALHSRPRLQSVSAAEPIAGGRRGHDDKEIAVAS